MGRLQGVSMSGNYRVSSAILAECMNMVSDATKSLLAAQAALESAAYKLKQEQDRLGKLFYPLEGRKSMDEPIDPKMSVQNDAWLTLIDTECEAASDRERQYREVAKLVGKAIEELEDK